MEHVYEGRAEFDGFGHVFLPDTETEHGDVPSIGAWIEEHTGGITTQLPDVRRVRLTVELLEAK